MNTDFDFFLFFILAWLVFMIIPYAICYAFNSALNKLDYEFDDDDED
jgi:hypothetical protein